MTIPEIAQRRGMTRQGVHRIARSDPNFPQPVFAPGSTRPRYPEDAVDDFFKTRVLRPGRRTDLEAERQQDATDTDDEV